MTNQQHAREPRGRATKRWTTVYVTTRQLSNRVVEKIDDGLSMLSGIHSVQRKRNTRQAVSICHSTSFSPDELNQFVKLALAS